MTSYYTEKTTKLLQELKSGGKLSEFYPPVIRCDIEEFPHINCYLPVSFNNKINISEEEKHKLHSLVYDAYVRNKTFKRMVDDMDWNTDKIAIIKGFHETEYIKDMVSLHFNVCIYKKSREYMPTLHIVADRHAPIVFKITKCEDLEF